MCRATRDCGGKAGALNLDEHFFLCGFHLAPSAFASSLNSKGIQVGVLLRGLSDDRHDLSSELRPVCSRDGCIWLRPWPRAAETVVACGRASEFLFHLLAHSVTPRVLSPRALPLLFPLRVSLYLFPPSLHVHILPPSAILLTLCILHVVLDSIIYWVEVPVHTALLVM